MDGRRPDPDPESIVRLAWGAVRNHASGPGGWIPQVWEDDRAMRSDYRTRAFDYDEARSMARDCAYERAARYLGDWHVEIDERIVGEVPAGSEPLPAITPLYLVERGWSRNRADRMNNPAV